jgi:phosphosulfolactate synthase
MDIKLAWLPERPAKPRTKGLTVLQDEGLSLTGIEDIISTSGHLIDLVRISTNAIFSAESLSERVRRYKQAGISPFVSGIMFEAAYIRESLDSYLDLLEANGFDHIEVSDGIVEIPPEEKAAIIQNLSGKFLVISKIGAKFKKAFFRYEKWKEYITAESKAGSYKIIIEGGEAGTSQVISGKIDIKLNLVNHILSFTDPEFIIWEAPRKKHQIWFINKLGVDVNLADICPQHILGLESQRLGMHWKTLSNNLPDSLTKGRFRKTDPMQDIDFQI